MFLKILLFHNKKKMKIYTKVVFPIISLLYLYLLMWGGIQRKKKQKRNNLSLNCFEDTKFHASDYTSSFKTNSPPFSVPSPPLSFTAQVQTN